jgi:hypothetical protein
MTPSHLLAPLRMSAVLVVALGSLADGAVAQEERYLYNLKQPRGPVGPATKLKVDCEPNAVEGSVTCDTEIENPATDTPAKLQYQLFEN